VLHVALRAPEPYETMLGNGNDSGSTSSRLDSLDSRFDSVDACGDDAFRGGIFDVNKADWTRLPHTMNLHDHDDESSRQSSFARSDAGSVNQRVRFSADLDMGSRRSLIVGVAPGR
jgi:hypothetical protein